MVRGHEKDNYEHKTKPKHFVLKKGQQYKKKERKCRDENLRRDERESI